MKAKLVDFLVCPKCKTSLKCDVTREDPSFPWVEIIEGTLTCPDCRRKFPITAGVPRIFLAEQLPSDVQNTVDGFGWEWQKFNEPIQDTYMTSKTHFLDFIYPITEEFFEGKVVLDAGCGLGRFLKLGAEWGSRDIIGVDLSGAADVAYQNTRMIPNAHVIQADLLELPLAQSFDYVFSIGVLMCVQKPKEAFSNLAKLLRPGGQISVWVYSQENNWWVSNVLTPIREHVTSRLPRQILYAICHFLGVILYALIKAVYEPANKHARGLRLRRILPYNDYLYYSSRLSYDSLVSVIFDHLVPQLVEYVSRDELESWFRHGELSVTGITPRNNMSWRGHGTRPRLANSTQTVAV